MQNYNKEEFNSLDVCHKTDMSKLMRFYSAGSSNNSSLQRSNSSSSGSGTSLSQATASPNLDPAQLLSLYGQALPSIGNTTNQVANNSIGAPALNAATQGAVEGVNAINLNGLSPGEGNAIERSTNQGNASTGNLGLNNSTNTIANALNFGGAFNSKIGLLNNATNTAAGVSNAANTSLGTASSLFNPLANNANASKSQSTSNSQFANSSISSGFGSGYGSSDTAGVNCCFIFLQSFHGILPDYVRECRDVYYRKYPQIANGYKRMAKYLVPVMKHSPLVNMIVWHTMVSPLTKHGYSIIKNKKQFQHKKIRKFWFNVWYILGV